MKKKSTSQASWSILSEGVSSARVEAHIVRSHINQMIDAIKEQPKLLEIIYKLCGDNFEAIPKHLSKLERSLDRTNYALISMGGEWYRQRLTHEDREMVDMAAKYNPTPSPSTSKQSEHMRNKQSEHMRKSANEMLRNLEMRVARLERSSTRSALPPGFEGFGFDDVPTKPISTKRLFEKKYIRGLSKITDPNKLMKDHSFIEGGIHYSDNATFIYVDLPSSQAKKIGRKFFKNLKGKRNFPSHIPYFHDNILVVGTNDGKITEVRNLEMRVARLEKQSSSFEDDLLLVQKIYTHLKKYRYDSEDLLDNPEIVDLDLFRIGDRDGIAKILSDWKRRKLLVEYSDTITRRNPNGFFLYDEDVDASFLTPKGAKLVHEMIRDSLA